MIVYTAPEVTVPTDFDYQVTISDARAQSAAAITTNFRTHVRPSAMEYFGARQPSVLFNPVILSLNTNGSEIPVAVELVADVRDDSSPAQLIFQWSYTPYLGTPAATFANNGRGNPGLFQGYIAVDEGTITLAVTDEHNGNTTLNYPLRPGPLPPLPRAPGLKRIVAGNAHTYALTSQNRVRCWGDNQIQILRRERVRFGPASIASANKIDT